ncbi:hypothetical protein BGY98DRAFT_10946 [Russula aff. rugulosa BPL654]|nr:hypothetical protein BGY98DRAFT_10946 [Russula aff. rugulosa BPL654]
MWGITAPFLFLSTVWTLFFAASRFHHVVATTTSPSFLPQGFLFDWNPAGTTVPIPITQQCETLHITWERGSTSVGQNPTAPYYLQIFTSCVLSRDRSIPPLKFLAAHNHNSTYVVPFLIPAGSGTSFDYQVPFSPGTQVS